MESSWSLFRLCLFVVNVIVQIYGEETCVGSKAEPVSRCPRTKYEWKSEALIKNCSSGTLRPSLVYHCLINTWVNMTLSVCAKPKRIIGYHCPEFNMRGCMIEPNLFTSCRNFSTSCQFRYESTEAYNLQECYALVPKPIGERQTIFRKTTSDIISKSNVEMSPVCLSRFLLILLHLIRFF
ncbi:uncharacterized protein LOC134258188 [Saccostrea cucullata]|uniref:uncharacterized protein LOC134258188 n=1 Tax=Saccostrea cuccullata TaxID=36930 RepID=UPI002ED484C8